MSEHDGFGIVDGRPETWDEFSRRAQWQFGDAARVFICQQVGVDGAPKPVTMILIPGPIRPDLLREVAMMVSGIGKEGA